ncbi:MAG: methyltransferase domain-containing protein [Thermoanaerobacteraceae bacterium]|nr:methyltransferase domain-containing protein [Thermoanaerobacteraceae bacterium]
MHKFNPKKAEKLLDPRREKILPVEAVLRKLSPIPGEYFADIGCGPGYFTIPLARQLGPHGRVYAVDISEEMLELLRERVAQEHLTNVKTVLSGESAITLPNNAVDGVLVVNVLHELEPQNRSALVRELKRIARSTGRLYIIDWAKEQSEVGPPVSERVAVEEVVRYLEEQDIKVIDTEPVGTGHYLVSAVFSTLE